MTSSVPCQECVSSCTSYHHVASMQNNLTKACIVFHHPMLITPQSCRVDRHWVRELNAEGVKGGGEDLKLKLIPLPLCQKCLEDWLVPQVL